MIPHYVDQNYVGHLMQPRATALAWTQVFSFHANDKLCLDLVDSLLRFDPASRATAMEGLLHAWFDTPLRTSRGKNFGPPLFDFQEEELWLVSDEARKRLMPRS